MCSGCQLHGGDGIDGFLQYVPEDLLMSCAAVDFGEWADQFLMRCMGSDR